jgi:hypothetical protein
MVHAATGMPLMNWRLIFSTKLGIGTVERPKPPNPPAADIVNRRVAKKLKLPQERAVIPRSQNIDMRDSGVPPIFECQITGYDRPPCGEKFEKLRSSR